MFAPATAVPAPAFTFGLNASAPAPAPAPAQAAIADAPSLHSFTLGAPAPFSFGGPLIDMTAAPSSAPAPASTLSGGFSFSFGAPPPTFAAAPAAGPAAGSAENEAEADAEGAPGEGEAPSDAVPQAAPADLASRLLLANECVSLQVRAALKRFTAATSSWASLDVGDLRLVKDAATGRSRVVFTPPTAPRALVNCLLSAATRVGEVEDAGGGGKARLTLDLPQTEGLVRYLVATKTRAQAVELAAALKAAAAVAAKPRQ